MSLYVPLSKRTQGATLDQTYVCHSSLWKNSAAYVALTRHRDNVEIFASRETVRGMEKVRAGEAQTAAKDLEVMARGLGRAENKRAATAYRIDNDAAVRAELESVATLADPRAQKRSPVIRVTTSAAAPIVAPVAATTAKRGWGAAREAFTGKESSRTAGAAAKGLGGVASVAGKALSGLASIFEGLLGGASSPEQVSQAKEDARTATTAPASRAQQPSPERGPVDPVDAFLEAERQQRAAMRALDAVARVTGPPDITPETTNKKDRDRDEGQSL